MKSKILIISVAFNLIAVLFFIGKRLYFKYKSNQPIEASSIFQDQWNNMLVSVLAPLRIDSNDVVFVGTSLTAAFPLTEKFGMFVKNRGIGGNFTRHILSRIEGIAQAHPRMIFLEGGINDIINNTPSDTIINNMIGSIEKIRTISPRTEIILHSLTPLGEKYGDKNELIREVNMRLAEYCKKGDIKFIDLFTPLQKGDILNEDYTIDGLHFNCKGYDIWAFKVNRLILSHLKPII